MLLKLERRVDKETVDNTTRKSSFRPNFLFRLFHPFRSFPSTLACTILLSPFPLHQRYPLTFPPCTLLKRTLSLFLHLDPQPSPLPAHPRTCTHTRDILSLVALPRNDQERTRRKEETRENRWFDFFTLPPFPRLAPPRPARSLSFVPLLPRPTLSTPASLSLPNTQAPLHHFLPLLLLLPSSHLLDSPLCR